MKSGSRWSRAIGEVLNEASSIDWSGGDQSLAPTIQDALKVARGVSDLRRSQHEGRKIIRAL